MKRLNITKEQFEKSRYFKNKYGTLEYVSESGKLFKTNKGKVLMFKESEGGVTCHATCVDWDAPKTKTFKTLAQCKRWMETTADEIAAEWGSSVEGSSIWVEDDELIVMSGNGKEVANFKIVPDYEDFHDPNEYYQESANKKFGRKFVKESSWDNEKFKKQIDNILYIYSLTRNKGEVLRDLFKVIDDVYAQGYADGKRDSVNESRKPRFVKESYHGRVKVEASLSSTGRTAEEALELLHNRLLDADAKITDENGNPNPEIVDKYNYWFDENGGDVDFDICRDNNSNGFIQMDIKAI